AERPPETRAEVQPPSVEPAAGPVSLSFQALAAPLPPWAPVKDRFSPQLVTFHQPDHPLSAKYRSLLAELLAPLPTEGSKVLLFTAAAPGAGTSTVLLNLAITAARQGNHRVAVVDADLERPALAERLGLCRVPGLAEVLEGAVSLHRALQATGQENL